MLPFNGHALRARLTADFKALSHGVTRASEIDEIFTALTRETYSTLQDLVLEWGAENNVLRRLPDELLAQCFAWLPLKSCIAVSHVSCHWRAVALANPAIWADLPESFGYAPELLRVILSRTGCRPLDLCDPESLFTFEPDELSIVHESLLEHMHHIRRLDLGLPLGSLPLTTLAPMLQEISGIEYHVDIPSDFLGGAAQRLRTVLMSTVSLPIACPALSTVTTLTLCGPSTMEQATTYAHLFSLFPSLHYLSLQMLQVEFSALLPSGRPPASLRELDLRTQDPGYDLTPHCLNWHSNTLRSASLDQETLVMPLLHQLIGVPNTLEIGIEHGHRQTIITSRRWYPWLQRSVTLPDAAEDGAGVPDLLLDAQIDLRNVQYLDIPSSFLASSLRVLPSMPALRQLLLSFTAHSDPLHTPASHVFPWEVLQILLQVQGLCPTLAATELKIGCANENCPLTVDDVRELVSQLAALGGRGLHNVCVDGVPWRILDDVDDSATAAFGFFFT